MAFTATAPINKLFDFNRNAALIINAMNGNSNDVVRLSAHRPDLGVYANAFRDMLLNVSGQTVAAKSGTPGATGAWFAQAAQTFTDSDTAESGTAAIFSATSFGRPTVAASNATVTVTDGATVYIANSPANGTNVTVTNPYALWVDAGNVRLDGDLIFNAAAAEIVPGATSIALKNNADNANNIFVADAGLVCIRDSANASSTIGLTINQGGADNEIFALKSSDIAHGVTGTTETDTYAAIKKAAATGGGVEIIGVAVDTNVQAIRFLGVGDSDTTHSTAGLGVFNFQAQNNDGTATAAAPAADSNLLTVRAGTTTRFILDADGDSHQDVGTAWTAFDTHDDIALLTDLSIAVGKDGDPVRTRFNDWVKYNREELERVKLVGKAEGDARPLVNMSKLSMLLVGAVRQLGDKLEAQRAEIAAMKAHPALGPA